MARTIDGTAAETLAGDVGVRIGPLFKWFGSKWQSARHYPQPHGAIVEPYAGGAGYSLNYCDMPVVLWDADPNVTLLWRWLIGEATREAILEIPIGLPEGTDIRSLPLTAGQRSLLKHWQRTNNVGDCWTISPWGHLPGQWTARTRSRVADEHAAVRHWMLADPWPIVAEPHLTWFIDPPYQGNYRYRASLPPFNYGELATRVATINRRSTVIVCEAVGKRGETPSYLPFEPSHRSVTSRRKSTQSHHSNELVYVRKALP